jgi:hypothetical protein
MAFCIKCTDEYDDRRAALGYKTCLPCAKIHTPKQQFVIIDVNKSNPVVGTLAELAAANAKGPRTW